MIKIVQRIKMHDNTAELHIAPPKSQTSIKTAANAQKIIVQVKIDAASRRRQRLYIGLILSLV